MLNGKPLIEMDRRNVVFSLVQDRSKIQTFTPTIFKMSAQQQQLQQQQPTAEKSVQTQDMSNTTTVMLTNNSLAHMNSENTATEVAKTLVSLASGQQPLINTNKAPTIVNVPKPNSLPILSLADYTTHRGVPTATALATQAKISPVKHEKMITGVNGDDDDDDQSMSTDEYESTRTDPSSLSQTSNKSSRHKIARNNSTSKFNKSTVNEIIQYGPIAVKPRKGSAPTLASGRKSKDEPLPPDEDLKRMQRRDRNKQAAAKCRRKRNELREELEKRETLLTEEQKNLERAVQILTQKKAELQSLIERQAIAKKLRLPVGSNNVNLLAQTKNDVKQNPNHLLLDAHGNPKRVMINIANPQDLFNSQPMSRVTSFLTNPTTTNDNSSTSSSTTVPMITIHIIPEMSQALLGTMTVDKTKLAEILQQTNGTSSTTTITSMTNSISDSLISNSDSTANSSS